jgi:DNA-binding MarR family transcriptional regulator
MSYSLVRDLVSLIEVYDKENKQSGNPDIPTFLKWLQSRFEVQNLEKPEPDWIGKSNGRSADSVINTSLVHLYRYARLHAKEAILGSEFSTSDDLFYLISLVAEGSMTKTALIKYNVHEKPAGIQIINRLLSKGFVVQKKTEHDKRNRVIQITASGKEALGNHLQQMRLASQNVTEPLNYSEKMELIKLLLKMEDFHQQKTNR